MPSASLRNSILICRRHDAAGRVLSALAAYALSRVRVPGRDLLLYGLLLLSSIITGTAAMVPIFLLMFQLGLIDSQLGVIAGAHRGPAAGGDLHPQGLHGRHARGRTRSGAGLRCLPLQMLRHVVLPIARPGLATIAVWAVVNAWGNFLIGVHPAARPGQVRRPAVVMYTFYTEGGQANLALISAFSLLYSMPVVALYFFVNRRYGFRFHGGIKS